MTIHHSDVSNLLIAPGLAPENDRKMVMLSLHQTISPTELIQEGAI